MFEFGDGPNPDIGFHHVSGTAAIEFYINYSFTSLLPPLPTSLSPSLPPFLPPFPLRPPSLPPSIAPSLTPQFSMPPTYYSLLFLFLNALFYGIMAWYLDSVVRGEQGEQRVHEQIIVFMTCFYFSPLPNN